MGVFAFREIASCQEYDGKIQSYKIEGSLCLMLNCTSPCRRAQTFVSTSLNITHRGCTFHLCYSYWTITSLCENTISQSPNLVPRLFSLILGARPPAEKIPWYCLVTCLPESGKVTKNSNIAIDRLTLLKLH